MADSVGPTTKIKPILRRSSDKAAPSSSSKPGSASNSKRSSRRISWTVDVREHSKDEMEHLVAMDDCIDVLCKGEMLLKLRGAKVMERFFYLDQARTKLCWVSKRDTVRGIPLKDIRGVVPGKHTNTLLNSVHADVSDDICFTIQHGKRDELDLVAPDSEVATLWVAAMRQLTAAHNGDGGGSSSSSSNSNSDSSGDSNYRLRMLLKIVRGAVGTMRIDAKSAVSLVIKHLQPSLHPDFVMQRFNNELERASSKSDQPSPPASEEHKKDMSAEEFVQFYLGVATRRELYLFMRQYGDEKGCLDARALSLFLQLETLEAAASEGKCREIIGKYALSSAGEATATACLGMDGLTNYLVAETSLVDKREDTVHHNMDLPLN
eukprot:UC1_evm1s2171